MPAFCCFSQPYKRIAAAVFFSSSSEISPLKNFSLANLSSRFFPMRGNPITDVFLNVIYSFLWFNFVFCKVLPFFAIGKILIFVR